MSLSSLAGFYRAAGRPVELLEGGLWVAETGLSVMAIPGVVGLRPRLEELNAMLRRMRRVAALFAVEPGTGVNVSRFVLRDRSYGLHSLQRQFRQQTRAALGVCEVRPVQWSEMARKGLPAYRDSQLRHGAALGVGSDHSRWTAYCEAASSVDGLEVSGCVTRDGELASYMVTWTHERVCHALQLHWADAFKALHPTHVLYFETARERMGRSGIDVFSLGRQTLPAMTAVDRFKEHAGFQREPCTVAVVLHPWLRWLLVNPGSLGILRAGRRSWGGVGRLRHLEVLEAAVRTRLP